MAMGKAKVEKPLTVMVHQHVASRKCCNSCMQTVPAIFEIQIGSGRFPAWHDWCRPCTELFAKRANTTVVFPTLGGSKKVRVEKARKAWDETTPIFQSGPAGNPPISPSRGDPLPRDAPPAKAPSRAAGSQTAGTP